MLFIIILNQDGFGNFTSREEFRVSLLFLFSEKRKILVKFTKWNIWGMVNNTNVKIWIDSVIYAMVVCIKWDRYDIVQLGRQNELDMEFFFWFVFLERNGRGGKVK
jgi:hypothetical protein